ncbi:hypothetical protein ACH49C_35870 [Rhodococcus sp. NPDC019609]|uniref:hypothetical protein n=1 Tax=Rhodococcus sp. NPDC019609 TaxID=3364504 RepID=UPI0037BADA99
MSAKHGYKWIAARIEELDPRVDYEEIWKLSTCYYVNDFTMNILYSTGFPHFMLAPSGGQTISRGGHGKVILEHQKRETDTMNHFWKWFEFGPSDLRTQQSIRQVNNLHMKYARQMPGHFANNDEFVYTMCWIGADMHRLRLRIGLPGYTENQQIACQKYWNEIAKFFISENGDITGFPTTFQGMLDHLDYYENLPWEHSEEGALACEHLLQQFDERWFKGPLKGLGRTIILALLDDSAHRVHRLPYPSKFAQWAVMKTMKTIMFTQERIAPDPKLSTPEKKRRAAEKAIEKTALANTAAP